jgi:PIN domain nuclease of toxin-antitoxin system
MRLLADTHAFIWFVAGDPRLSSRARQAMEESGGEWLLSGASVWEMAIKAGAGRLALPSPVSEYVAEKVRDGLRVLSVEWPHAAAVETMPPHHRDPFDRLIIAQARTEGLAVVTRDSVFRDYGVRVVW